jgi:hypothetical protein
MITAVDSSIKFDLIYFYTWKKSTSKYTISNIIGAKRLLSDPGYNKIRSVTAAAGSPHIVEDVTQEALHGVREFTVKDVNITTPEKARELAQSTLTEQYRGEEDPIQVGVVNPGDMYNILPGDTLTVTAANLNLSSATRALTGRIDTISEAGWQTMLLLSRNPRQESTRVIWDILKVKRY